MASDETRERLIEAGLKALLANGYNATGIKDIVAAAGVPKGSFYYYFASKEAFVEAVVERYHETAVAQRDAILSDTALPPVARVRRSFEIYAEHFSQTEQKHGCLFGNLSLEVADQSEVLRKRISAGFTAWESALRRILRQAADLGELPPGLDPDQLAAFCLNSWEGALVRMRAEGSAAPLRLFLTVVFDRMLTR